jgi:hypothetical protein
MLIPLRFQGIDIGIFIHRFKQDATTTATVSTFCIRLINEKNHPATDWARLISVHFDLLNRSRPILKLNKHTLTPF